MSEQVDRMDATGHDWREYEAGALDALDYVLDQDPGLEDLTMRAAEQIGESILARRKRERGGVSLDELTAWLTSDEAEAPMLIGPNVRQRVAEAIRERFGGQ